MFFVLAFCILMMVLLIVATPSLFEISCALVMFFGAFSKIGAMLVAFALLSIYVVAWYLIFIGFSVTIRGRVGSISLLAEEVRSKAFVRKQNRNRNTMNQVNKYYERPVNIEDNSSQPTRSSSCQAETTPKYVYHDSFTQYSAMCAEPLDELFLSVARLAADRQFFGVRDISRSFGIDDTRAYRIINELVARNFVERADKGSGFASKVSYEKLEKILTSTEFVNVLRESKRLANGGEEGENAHPMPADAGKARISFLNDDIEDMIVLNKFEKYRNGNSRLTNEDIDILRNYNIEWDEEKLDVATFSRALDVLGEEMFNGDIDHAMKLACVDKKLDSLDSNVTDVEVTEDERKILKKYDIEIGAVVTGKEIADDVFYRVMYASRKADSSEDGLLLQKLIERLLGIDLD